MDEAKKKKKHPILSGTPDKHNRKRKALIAKLKKMPGVRDPEALATWIGLRKGGMLSHG